MEDFVWRAVAEAAPRCRVEHGGDALEFVVGEVGHVAITGQKSTDPTVGVFDGTFLPGTVWIAAEGLGAGGSREDGIGGELGATIEGGGPAASFR